MRKLWVLAVLSGSLFAQTQRPFTLEQVTNFAFPTELAASPTGGRLAWIVNDRGPRNIWIAEPPAYQGRALTHYTKDDGQEFSDLTWTPTVP